MGLFIMSSNLVEQCFMDFDNILCENFEGPVAGSIDEDLDGLAKGFNTAVNNIKKGGQPTGEASLINSISKVKNLNWLQRKQVELEDKLHKYELQAKSDQTGTFKKIWIKIKSFIVKIIQLITKALAKAHRFVKNRYLGYKIKKQTKVVAKKHGMDLGNNPLF